MAEERRPWLVIQHLKLIWDFDTECQRQRKINPNITPEDVIEELKRNFTTPPRSMPAMVRQASPGWFGTRKMFLAFVDTLLGVASLWNDAPNLAYIKYHAMSIPLIDFGKSSFLTWDNLCGEFRGWDKSKYEEHMLQVEESQMDVDKIDDDEYFDMDRETFLMVLRHKMYEAKWSVQMRETKRKREKSN